MSGWFHVQLLLEMANSFGWLCGFLRFCTSAHPVTTSCVYITSVRQRKNWYYESSLSNKKDTDLSIATPLTKHFLILGASQSSKKALKVDPVKDKRVSICSNLACSSSSGYEIKVRLPKNMEACSWVLMSLGWFKKEQNHSQLRSPTLSWSL